MTCFNHSELAEHCLQGDISTCVQQLVDNSSPKPPSFFFFFASLMSSHTLEHQSHPLVLTHTSPIVHSATASPLSLLQPAPSHLTLPSLSISAGFPPSPPPSQSRAVISFHGDVRGGFIARRELLLGSFQRAAALEALFSSALCGGDHDGEESVGQEEGIALSFFLSFFCRAEA